MFIGLAHEIEELLYHFVGAISSTRMAACTRHMWALYTTRVDLEISSSIAAYRLAKSQIDRGASPLRGLDPHSDNRTSRPLQEN